MRTAVWASVLAIVGLFSTTARAECAVTPSASITREEAEAIGEVVCSVGHGSDVRAEKIGARYVITWTVNGQPRQVTVMSLDELPDAASRTVVAASTPVTPSPPSPPRHVHFIGSLIFPTALQVGGTNWGIGVGIVAGNEQWQAIGELRFAGDPIMFFPSINETPEPEAGTAGNGLFYVALSAGVRRAFPIAGGFAPFVGVGVALESIGQLHPSQFGSAPEDEAYLYQGGVAGTAETGVTMELTKNVAAEMSVRLDAPAFPIDDAGSPVHTQLLTGAFALHL